MGIGEKDMLWLELALTPEVTPRFVPALLERFGEIEAVFKAGLLDLGAAGLSGGAARGIETRAGRGAAEQEAKILESEGIGLICFDSESYPPLLRHVADPPAALFCRGTSSAGVGANVAMVGSRAASAYGMQAAHKLAGDLAARGVTVVSGMARGIDQACHIGALEVGGRTVAVIGSGFGHIYPPHSGKLVERIVADGALLTEFPFDTPPSKKTFPQRNRIVSGMSYATVVVEAAETSGALITAKFALDQDRELLAVPGPISARGSIGTNYIIKCGAKLVQRADDIVAELPREVREALAEASGDEIAVDLDENEAKVFELLSVDTPLHVDIIARRAGLGSAELSMILLGLEMKALVRQLPGMEYVRTMRG